jgi:tuftelin-interacting protein 11
MKECDAAIRLLEVWQPHLPSFIFSLVLTQQIFPKLQASLAKSQPAEIHRWLHPWLPTLGDRLEDLFALIRHEFSQILNQWSPPDLSALTMLRPWKGVFKPKDMETLLVRSIIPRLRYWIQITWILGPNQNENGKFVLEAEMFISRRR